MKEGKIINDPVYGFIRIARGLPELLIAHPLMQRLRRIRQLGMASAVYPSAMHSRFLHSIGAYHLMTEAVNTLKAKGVDVSDSEAEAVASAILMHDIGHGPFSHVLENVLIGGACHEDISLLMMERINRETAGALELTLRIFRNDYPKRFLHQLISSQLDMDRLDYLRRDSFFTGVKEGNIGSERIIKMLDVADDELVVNVKGLYSIENYLMARRSMYWQVYLHKTVVAAEKMLVNTLLRARRLMRGGHDVYASPALRHFLYNDIDAARLAADDRSLYMYGMLDDSDICMALKMWATCDDRVLSMLAAGLTGRRLFKVEVSGEPADAARVAAVTGRLAATFGIGEDDARWLMSVGTMRKDMYDISDEHISILMKDGTVRDLAETSELFDNSVLSTKLCKYYLCYQRFQ